MARRASDWEVPGYERAISRLRLRYWTLAAKILGEGSRGTDGRNHSLGQPPDTGLLCNYRGNLGDTTPVDAYPAGVSPYGAMDMAGNVWEWTGMSWENFKYPYESSDGREQIDAPDCITHVLRGGAFDFSGNNVRCAARYAGYLPYFGY